MISLKLVEINHPGTPDNRNIVLDVSRYLPDVLSFEFNEGRSVYVDNVVYHNTARTGIKKKNTLNFKKEVNLPLTTMCISQKVNLEYQSSCWSLYGGPIRPSVYSDPASRQSDVATDTSLLSLPSLLSTLRVLGLYSLTF